MVTATIYPKNTPKLNLTKVIPSNIIYSYAKKPFFNHKFWLCGHCAALYGTAEDVFPLKSSSQNEYGESRCGVTAFIIIM